MSNFADFTFFFFCMHLIDKTRTPKSQYVYSERQYSIERKKIDNIVFKNHAFDLIKKKS